MIPGIDFSVPLLFKLAYSYVLTPSGIDAKARITVRFLKRKMAEYQEFKTEIERLRAEVESEFQGLSLKG